MIEDFEKYFELFATDIQNYRALRFAENGDFSGAAKMLQNAKIKNVDFCKQVYVHAFEKRVEKHILNSKISLKKANIGRAYTEMDNAHKHHEFLIANETPTHDNVFFENAKNVLSSLYSRHLQNQARKYTLNGHNGVAKKVMELSLLIDSATQENKRKNRTPQTLALPKPLKPYRFDFTDPHLLQAYDMAKGGYQRGTSYHLDQIENINPQLKKRVEGYAHYRQAISLGKKAVRAVGDDDFAAAETYMTQSGQHLSKSRPDYDTDESVFKRNTLITRSIYEFRSKEMLQKARNASSKNHGEKYIENFLNQAIHYANLSGYNKIRKYELDGIAVPKNFTWE